MQFLKTDARPSTYKRIYQTLWDDIIKKTQQFQKHIILNFIKSDSTNQQVIKVIQHSGAKALREEQRY